MAQEIANTHSNPNLEQPHFGILFVDDEENARNYFSRFLSADFRVLIAASAEEALEILRRSDSRIGVVVADQRMPIVKGVNLLQQLRTEFPHVVRILTSAHADIDEIIKAINDGEIYRYISKPWDMQKLRGDIFSAMRSFEKKQHEQDLICEKRKGMYILTERLNEELRLPIMTIRSMGLTIDQHMPALIEAYKLNKPQDQDQDVLQPMELRTLEDTVGAISKEITLIQGYMGMLLMNTQEDKKQIKHNRRNSMQSAVMYALENYPYKPNEKELVMFEPDPKDNFLFHGARQNIVTILSNLLNNAFFALAKSRSKDKKINISLKCADSDNKVYIEDNGIGIAGNIKPYIFDEFFSSRNNRIGAGLPACRRAAQALGGSIECISKEGQFTRFIVTLPTCESE